MPLPRRRAGPSEPRSLDSTACPCGPNGPPALVALSLPPGIDRGQAGTMIRTRRAPRCPSLPATTSHHPPPGRHLMTRSTSPSVVGDLMAVDPIVIGVNTRLDDAA